MLARVIGGQERRVRPRPQASAAGEEALLPPELAEIRECVDELRQLSPSPSASSPSPLPRPSRHDSTPVSSPEHRRLSSVFPRGRGEITVRFYESLTVGPTVRFLNILETDFCFDFSVYFSTGN